MLRLNIKRALFINGDHYVPLTCSIGVGSYAQNVDSDVDNFVASLDQTLLREKKTGKNRVSIQS